MAEEKAIRFGIMGCAEIARKVSRAIHLAPNSTLHAVASRSVEKAKQFAIKNGLAETVKLYGTYTELLDDPSVDAVYMPLPTSLHSHWAVLAAEKKKHLLLEKPTALNVSDLDKILEACQKNGVQFMDASMWFHHPRTSKMKELLSDSDTFGKVNSIHSSSTYAPPQEFLENDIRVKPDLDALGALGDAGWYCIGSILWAMNQKLPTTVIALPAVEKNSAGVILSCSASLYWDDGTVATFFCSFLAHESMDLFVNGSKGSLCVKDFIIPIEETSAAFSFASGSKFLDLYVGWNYQPKEIHVASQLPQEAMMIKEFSELVNAIKFLGGKPDHKWHRSSRLSQLVLDAVKNSIDIGFKPVHV